MVSPIYIIIALLGVSFLIPLFGEKSPKITVVVFLMALSFVLGLTEFGLWQFMSGHFTSPMEITTAGLNPPWAINLRFGFPEAIILTAINILAFLTGAAFYRYFHQIGNRAYSLFLLTLLGLNGLVLTRDIFNIFVFTEIASISMFGLIAMDLRFKSLTASFKYMLAGSLASIFLLLGIIYLYRMGHTLNLDDMIKTTQDMGNHPIILLGIFGFFISLVIEMKQFPANGWALDVYEATHPGIAGFLSAASSGAVFYVIMKSLPMANETWTYLLMIIGLTTFFASNLMGLKQEISNRLLGYSSIGQMGLLLFVLAAGRSLFHMTLQEMLSNTGYIIIIFGLFINHFLAKPGLFWLSATLKKKGWKDWRFGGNAPKVFLMALFTLALVGLPPFPGFWAKWVLIMELGAMSSWWIIGIILLGSLFEIIYMFRWMGHALAEPEESGQDVDVAPTHWLALTILAILLAGAGFFTARLLHVPSIWFVPVLAASVMLFLDFLPEKLRTLIALIFIGLFTWHYIPELSGLKLFFFILLVPGAGLLLLSSFARKKTHSAFLPLMILLIPSMGYLVLAADLLQFFFAWEWMTIASYFLIIQRREAKSASLSYAVFSIGGAYCILAAFAIGQSETVNWGFELLQNLHTVQVPVMILAAIGFLVKTGAAGLHLWLPGSYTESPDDFTPILSAVMSKAGILGLFMILTSMGAPVLFGVSVPTLIGWVGVLTAFLATFVAIFQEDAKKLLAWSSMGQVGYIVAGMAAMSHLGWVAALWHTANHFMFKGLLFITIAGVIYRTGTRNMYQMGGLIKKMPFSFFSVMIAIIAMSGVPPLTGFGSKWLLYEAMIEKGWYLQTGLAFMSGTVAFLYLFRLIHSIFLGMPKDEFKEIKEAPVWFLIPQGLLILAIMVVSGLPKLLIEPLSNMVSTTFPATLRWEDGTLISTIGYWNGTAMMILVMAVFLILMIWLIIASPKLQKVKPFNIGYAAEAPERPELTHYAYAFFEPYRRAFEPVLKSYGIAFWTKISDWFNEVGNTLRGIYTGNAQTYAVFILAVALATFIYSVGV